MIRAFCYTVRKIYEEKKNFGYFFQFFKNSFKIIFDSKKWTQKKIEGHVKIKHPVTVDLFELCSSIAMQSTAHGHHTAKTAEKRHNGFNTWQTSHYTMGSIRACVHVYVFVLFALWEAYDFDKSQLDALAYLILIFSLSLDVR